MKVVGLGDNVVDIYMHQNIMYPGGNAMNFAVYASFMDVKSAYLGVFGSDEAAEHVHNIALKLGLDLSHCRYAEGENGYSCVDLQDGDRVFLGSNKGGVMKEYPLKLSRLDLEYLSEFDIVHTTMFSYVEQEMPKLRQWCNFISMDFSDQFCREHLKTYCPYIDCACLSCSHMEEDDILLLMNEITKAGCRHMVIATRGSRGALTMVDGKLYRQSPCLIKAADTMGAGDSFTTRFLVSYCSGMEWARDFPEGSGEDGLTNTEDYQRRLIQLCLSQAAVFSSDICKQDGAFGHGKSVKETGDKGERYN